MKKTLKLIFTILVIAIANICLLINTVQAVEKGDEITIYSKGYFNRIIKKDGIIVKTAHAVYEENGKEYPVYCLNREVPGVGSVPSYNVKNEGKLDDLGLWRIIINGYPYKTLEQLGVVSEEEAYTATKQAVYCYIYNTQIEQYSAINESGVRTINAINTIVQNARNSTETFETPNAEIIPDEKWKIDKIDNKYISKQYKIKSNKNISKVMLNLESQPKGTKITNLENQEINEFNSNEMFKILIPIESLKESGNFKIKTQTQVESKPIIFGKAPNTDVQDYALTAYSFENIDSELIQEYKENNTKIIIDKKDKESKESLKGAKFEFLNENQKVIRVAETDFNGQIIYEKLIPGTYYIREIKAPEGYNIDMELKEIKIEMNEEKVIEIENGKIIVNTQVEQPKEEKTIVEVPVVEKQIVEVPRLPVTGM